MSTKERAALIFDTLTEKQLEEFISLFGGHEQSWDGIKEEVPDEWDRQMIENSRIDNDEAVTLDELLDKLRIEIK